MFKDAQTSLLDPRLKSLDKKRSVKNTGNMDADELLSIFMDFDRPRMFIRPPARAFQPEVQKKVQNQKREESGIEYAKEYEEKSCLSIAKNFEKINLTSDITMPTDAGTMPLEANEAPNIDNYRVDLPIFDSRLDILRQVSESPVIIINGPTGCGKSTQVPQYIYDSCKALKKPCEILISQPRRIAAITLAQRVANERKTFLGREIGYQVGLSKSDTEGGEHAGVLYCTTGVVLRKLIHEKTMNRYSHIIIDEIHERDIQVDFLLIVIRRLMAANPFNTRIILMSATMDTTQFVNIFRIKLEDGSVFEPPIIDLSASSRSFPIREIYLDQLERTMKKQLQKFVVYKEPGISTEMYSLTAQIISLCFRKHFENVNALPNPTILIFLPGIYEIEELHKILLNSNISAVTFNELRANPEILVLHSTLSTILQKAVFVANKERPRIVLSTNIAESSVTLPNVTHVIDFCLTKYNTKVKGSTMTSLVLDWASKNNCAQRAGRTGRVCSGTVIRMVSQDFFNKMKTFPVPEITRANLETVVIGLKELEMGTPLELLALAIDPPKRSAVIDAVLSLKSLGGLHRYNSNGTFSYDDADVTYLGRVMASLPLDVHLVRLIVIGYLFSVLEEMVIIAAGLTSKTVFARAGEQDIKAYVKKLNYAQGSQSDCIAILNAYNFWTLSNGLMPNAEEERKWCQKHGLDAKNLHEMRLLIHEIKSRLEKLGIKDLENTPKWEPQDKLFILKVVIAGSFGPSHFFSQVANSDQSERESYVTINNLDVFRTVFFTNMDRDLFGDVYKEQLRQIFISKEVADEQTKVDIVFDNPSSQKVYVTFSNDPKLAENENQMPDTKLFHQVGRIRPEVYKAVKLRQIQNKVMLRVKSHAETNEYAAAQGLGTIKNGVFTKSEYVIKHPEYIVEPTLATHKMYGTVTFVQNCSKFYFRPVKSFGPADQCDTRYQDYISELKMLMKNFEREALDMETADFNQLVVVAFKETFERGNFRGISIDNKAAIYLIDRGKTVFIEKGNLFVMADPTIQEKLEAFTPRIFECWLTAVKPSSVARETNDQWTKEATERMRAGVTDRKASLRIYSVVDGVASVQLVVKGIDWNQKLIDEGFAEECEESYLSKTNHDMREAQQYIIDKRNDPGHEFAGRVDQSLNVKEIPSPPLSECNKILCLKGPFSPIELELKPVSRTQGSKIVTDSTSVNCVLLNEDLLNFRGKFCVAGDVTISRDFRTMTIRETTVMPSRPGLAVIVALIFSPTAELRRNETKTNFVSALTGLGFDTQRERPFFGEHDAAMSIDFELSLQDLELINRLRSHLSYMLMTGTSKRIPNAVEAEKEISQQNIKKIVMDIFNKQRSIVDMAETRDAFDWNVDPEAVEVVQGKQEIFDDIPFAQLQPVTSEARDDLKRHIEDLQRCAISGGLYPQLCNLCNFRWETKVELQMHLLSKKHILHCDRVLKFSD